MQIPEWIIIHVTATTPAMVDVDARWVDRLHRTKGWLGCGYHEVITRAGERQNSRGGFRTRTLTAEGFQPGAHVGDCGVKWNKITIGISMAGGINKNGEPEANFTNEQYISLAEAVREYRDMFNISDDQVIGHRDLIKMTKAPPKACPCFSVQEWLIGENKRFGDTFTAPVPPRRPTSMLSVPVRYEVRAGDTLYAISRTYGVSVEGLLVMNPGVIPAKLEVGRLLNLL